MKHPYYKFKASEEQLSFRFESIGERCVIPKIVTFSPLFDNANIYNLAFGDIISENNFDDEAISNNNDRDKVLATVIQTMFVFFETYPNKIVFLTGSTPVRTRLYQIIISREYDRWCNIFHIDGITDHVQERFVPNKQYNAFLIRLKH